MKVLFIGGTGVISSACSELAIQRGIELVILNRGQSTNYPVPQGAQLLVADVRAAPEALAQLLDGYHFDAVVDWIAYTPADIERDIKLFQGKTGQFIFISSASAYQKPLRHYLITEDTPLANPYWQYSRDKIACEDRLMREYRERGFPITIVRPSHTYGPTQIPLCIKSRKHPFTVVDRMRRGQKVIVPGDGTSLWTLTWNGDFARGFVGLLGRDQAIGNAFHITSDEVMTWDQIYRQLGQAAGVEPNLIHIPSELIAAYDPDAFGTLIGDKANCAVFDNRKIKRLAPDFATTVPWSEGARRVIAWHEADPARCMIDDEANRQWDALIAAYMRAWPEAQS